MAKGGKIELISADHQSKSDFGPISASSGSTSRSRCVRRSRLFRFGLAISNLAKEKNVVNLNSGSASSDLTGAQCSPNTIHWVYDTWMLANGTGKALVKSGGDSWFFLTADYAFGHALERDTAAVVTANGGKVLGGVKHPLNNADFSSFLLQAQSSKAKIIGLANAGGDTTNSIKQAAEFGIVQGGQKLAGMLMFITDVHSLGLKVAQGLNFTETFYWDMNDQTRAFTKRFNEKYKKGPPTMVQAGVYSSLIHYFKALEALGGNPHDGRAVVAKMKEMPTDDPLFGKGSIRADGRKIHPAYLFEVKKPADSKYPWDYLQPRRHHPGDGSLHPAREERLPNAEEDLRGRDLGRHHSALSRRRERAFACPEHKISKTTPCTVEIGLNSRHFSPPRDPGTRMLSHRGNLNPVLVQAPCGPRSRCRPLRNFESTWLTPNSTTLSRTPALQRVPREQRAYWKSRVQDQYLLTSSCDCYTQNLAAANIRMSVIPPDKRRAPLICACGHAFAPDNDPIELFALSAMDGHHMNAAEVL